MAANHNPFAAASNAKLDMLTLGRVKLPRVKLPDLTQIFSTSETCFVSQRSLQMTNKNYKVSRHQGGST